MTGPNVAGGGGGEREENTASPPTSAWCTSTSVGSTMFEFTWNIADYQRKKESIKRDDSIQSSTFTIQANNKKSRWYLTFLPNGAAEEEENDSDEHEEEDEEEISIHGDVAVYLYQVSAYENYVTSLKFKISFLNSRTGDKMLVYDHGYGKKYRYHDSWGWGICDILVPGEFINDDTLTIVCEMTLPGNDVTKLGYTYNAEASKPVVKREDCGKLVADFERLLDSSTLTDVKIKCEGKILECHKAILSARSSVFRAMFQHDMRESKSNEIIIPDLDFNTVKDMVRYVYSGRVSDLPDKSDLLLSAADKYDIRDLKEECCQSLSTNLAVDQVVDILVLSDLHKAVELKATAISFLLAHKEEVFSQPDWKIKLKGHPDLLLEVLESSVESRGLPPPSKRRRRK